MKHLPALALSAAAGAVVLAAFMGCGLRQPAAPALDAVSPETRERMKLVMVKIGQHYGNLESGVDRGQLSQAAAEARYIVALGAHLAPHRDPGMPGRYLALQAQFDEAARELSRSAQLGRLQEVSLAFDEMQRTCRECHVEFRVPLSEPYCELGFDPRAAK